MKTIKLPLLLVSIFALLLSTASRAASVTGDEYQAVVDTAYSYFTGAANGDQKMLAQAFDVDFGDVKMINVDKETGKETIRTVGLKEFAGYFKKATQDTWQADVLSVDIVDDKMAMVKLNFETSKTYYIDYLVMYKREGAWRIVNKTFVSKKK